MNNGLARNTLLTIYKSFVRPHLDYGDVLYHQPNKESMNSKLESVKYSAALAITGAKRGTSRSKLCKELGLESLKSRRSFRCLYSLNEVISTDLTTYIFNLTLLSLGSFLGGLCNTRGSRFHALCNFLTKNIITWQKYSLSTETHFGIKSCDVTSYISDDVIICKLGPS